MVPLENGSAGNDKPLTTEEVDRYKKLLREHAPSNYNKLFPEQNGQAD